MSIGIDFGTTNSSIAFQPYPGAAPECAPVEDHSSIPFDAVLRTAVLVDQAGNLVPGGVGAAAVDQLSWRDGTSGRWRRLLVDFKPMLSTFRLRSERTERRQAVDSAFYDHLRQEPQVVSIQQIIVSGDLPWSREELMTAGAAIFSHLLSAVPKSVMNTDPGIVVGVPLTFPDFAKKRALEMIVRAAGERWEEPYRDALRRVRFIPEPVGASLLYGDEYGGRASTERVLVFDSGGGTLDLALLEFERRDGRLRPVRQLALGGEVLAGRRFDDCLIEHCLLQHREAIRRSNAQAASPEEVTTWQIAQAAESIKIELSSQEDYEELSLLSAGVRVHVTRQEFEGWAQPILQEIEKLVRAVVGSLDDVDTVVMVGGSSLIPCVQELIRRLFPLAEHHYENPLMKGRGEGVERSLTAVSRGLALYDEVIGGAA
jgi:molecular chaperone DnaK (HSP70)